LIASFMALTKSFEVSVNPSFRDRIIPNQSFKAKGGSQRAHGLSWKNPFWTDLFEALTLDDIDLESDTDNILISMPEHTGELYAQGISQPGHPDAMHAWEFDILCLTFIRFDDMYRAETNAFKKMLIRNEYKARIRLRIRTLTSRFMRKDNTLTKLMTRQSKPAGGWANQQLKNDIKQTDCHNRLTKRPGGLR
jgi:hypothetical protein